MPNWRGKIAKRTQRATNLPLKCLWLVTTFRLKSAFKLTSYEENGLTNNPVSSKLSNRLQIVPLLRLHSGGLLGLAICHLSIDDKGRWEKSRSLLKFVNEAERRGLSCGVTPKPSSQASINDDEAAALPNELMSPFWRISAGDNQGLEELFESVIGVDYLTKLGTRSGGF